MPWREGEKVSTAFERHPLRLQVQEFDTQGCDAKKADPAHCSIIARVRLKRQRMGRLRGPLQRYFVAGRLYGNYLPQSRFQRVIRLIDNRLQPPDVADDFQDVPSGASGHHDLRMGCSMV